MTQSAVWFLTAVRSPLVGSGSINGRNLSVNVYWFVWSFLLFPSEKTVGTTFMKYWYRPVLPSPSGKTMNSTVGVKNFRWECKSHVLTVVYTYQNLIAYLTVWIMKKAEDFKWQQIEVNTFVKGVWEHVRIRLSKGNTVNCVRNVECVGFSRHELMDMPAVSHNAFTMSNVKIACHFIHSHVPINTTSLPLDSICEWVNIITNTLFWVVEYLWVTPSFCIICILQWAACIAAPT